MLDLVRTAAPVQTPVSVDEAKRHLRIEIGDASEDDYVADAIAGAVAYLDGYDGILGKSILTQTWKLHLPSFEVGPGDPIWRHPVWRLRRHARGIVLPAPPLRSVAEVAYVDANGVPQTLAEGDDYQVLDGRVSEIQPAPFGCWPCVQCENPRAVSITYTAGYADDGPGLAIAANNLRRAILLLVGHFYANREAVVGIDSRDSPAEPDFAVSALIAPYRLFPV